MGSIAGISFIEFFPYLASAFGGLLTLFIGMMIKGQTKTQNNQEELNNILTKQSTQLTKLTVLLENVIQDKIPSLERRLDKIEDKF